MNARRPCLLASFSKGCMDKTTIRFEENVTFVTIPQTPIKAVELTHVMNNGAGANGK